MKKFIPVAIVAGAAVSWRLSHWIRSVEEKSRPEPEQEPAIDHDALIRRLTLATEGMDEAIREGVPFDAEHIHDHVQRGVMFDEEFGNRETD